jgi:hypothetical protein
MEYYAFKLKNEKGDFINIVYELSDSLYIKHYSLEDKWTLSKIPKINKEKIREYLNQKGITFHLKNELIDHIKKL